MKLYSNKLFLVLLLLLSFSCKRDIDNSVYSISKASGSKVSRLHPKTTKFFGKNTLAIVSWNIQDLGRTKTPEHIYQIATILRDVDIVAIQEVVAKDPAGAQEG